jgi:hypothetical protein
MKTEAEPLIGVMEAEPLIGVMNDGSSSLKFSFYAGEKRCSRIKWRAAHQARELTVD